MGAEGLQSNNKPELSLSLRSQIRCNSVKMAAAHARFGPTATMERASTITGTRVLAPCLPLHQQSAAGTERPAGQAEALPKAKKNNAARKTPNSEVFKDAQS